MHENSELTHSSNHKNILVSKKLEFMSKSFGIVSWLYVCGGLVKSGVTVTKTKRRAYHLP